MDKLLRAAKCADPLHPTDKEARKVEKEARAVYQERLLERVTIIQRRLDSENERLLRQQQNYSRSQVHSVEAEREFERFCAEATFRIGVMEQRLERQEAAARRRYLELEARLKADPRLRRG